MSKPSASRELHQYSAYLRNIVLVDFAKATIGPFILRRVEPPHTANVIAPLDETFPELKGLTRKQQSALLPRMLESEYYRHLVWADVEVALQTDNETPPLEASRQINEFVDILRVTKYGGVTRRARLIDEFVSTPAREGGRVRGAEISRASPLPPYALTRADLEELQARFDWMYPYDDDFPDPSLTRFRSSYDRSSLLDSFIDLLVCLEAIYTDGDGGDNRYKISLRAAHHLANGSSNRMKRTYDVVTKAYRHRNNALHGRKEDREWIDEHYLEVWNVARASVMLDLVSAHATGMVMRGRMFDESYILHGREMANDAGVQDEEMHNDT